MQRLFSVIILVLFLAPCAAIADECTDKSLIPQTEKCVGFGATIRLNILRASIDDALGRAWRPAFYRIAVVHTGRAGRESDSYVSPKAPVGLTREWSDNFFVYVTLDYLAERSTYASLVRAGAQRVCELQYIDRPAPSTPDVARERREEIERCVYESMRSTEQYYFTALLREIELGDAYLAEFKDMPYPTLRDTIRARFGPKSSAAAQEQE